MEKIIKASISIIITYIGVRCFLIFSIFFRGDCSSSKNYFKYIRDSFSMLIQYHRTKNTANIILEELFVKHSISNHNKKKFLRYARKCILMLTIPPFESKYPISQTQLNKIGAYFGLCIPLFDDMYDCFSIEESRQFGNVINKWLTTIPFSSTFPTNGLLGDAFSKLFNNISCSRKADFLSAFLALNDAQIKSIQQRENKYITNMKLKKISDQKGATSFFMLTIAAFEIHQPKIIKEFGSWAQHLDDLNDIEQDFENGIITYMQAIGDFRCAKSYIKNSLNCLQEKFLQINDRENKRYSSLLRLSYAEKIGYSDFHRLFLRRHPQKKIEHVYPTYYWD